MAQRVMDATTPAGFRVLQDSRLRSRIGRRLLSPTLLTHFLRLADFLAIFLGALLVPLLREGKLGFASTETLLLLGVALCASNAFSLAGLYDESQLRRTGRQIRYVITLWTAAMVLGLVVLFLAKASTDVSRLWTFGWYLSTAVLLVLLRLGLVRAVAALRDAGFLLRRVLVVGHGAHGHATLERLRKEDPDILTLGYLEVDPARPMPDSQVAWLTRFLQDKRVEHVVLALPWSDTARAASLLGKLRRHPVSVSFLPGMDEAASPLPLKGITWFADRPALRLIDRPLDERKYLLKSLEDRILGTLLLLGISPLLLAIAAAIKLTSKGPVFFRQARVGFHGEQFRVFKFRSMYTDLCDRPDQGFVAHTTRNDPRITPLGAFLRKTSLDELPQLINVVLGDMSLVGPRPHAVAHDDHYGALIDEYLSRHRVKPGITGWAQVNGARGEISDLRQMEHRIRLDLEYIERWSVSFDVQILFQTAGLLARDSNAY